MPTREEYERGIGQVSAGHARVHTNDNFNDGGIEVRSMDSRDCKVGLFGDFLERVSQ